MKIIFWGTPEFAAVILDSLISNDYKPIAVVTAPDKPVGRKHILTPSPVKELAKKYGIAILQPEKAENARLEIINLRPELMIVAAYGEIIPKNIIEIPKYGSLNLHPSLLPKYRGASPIQAAILNGDQEIGTTIMLMDEKMDHGPIVGYKKLNIKNQKLTYLELSKQLANLGVELLIETLPKWLVGEIKPIPQNHAQATFTKIIKKEDGRIDWHKSAEQIERMTRAYYPWPSAYTKAKKRLLKIINASVLAMNHHKVLGTVFFVENKKKAVACGQDALILEKVQLEGKREMTVQEFLNGHPEIINSIFI
jgi:methionyl-tRNA formyltransferase